MFYVYPEAIATLTGSVFWAIIFFFMLITLGLDSTVSAIGQHLRFWHLSHAQLTHLNAHADISSRTRCLNFGMCLQIHPTIVYISSEGSGEFSHLRSLA